MIMDLIQSTKIVINTMDFQNGNSEEITIDYTVNGVDKQKVINFSELNGDERDNLNDIIRYFNMIIEEKEEE